MSEDQAIKFPFFTIFTDSIFCYSTWFFTGGSGFKPFKTWRSNPMQNPHLRRGWIPGGGVRNQLPLPLNIFLINMGRGLIFVWEKNITLYNLLNGRLGAFIYWGEGGVRRGRDLNHFQGEGANVIPWKLYSPIVFVEYIW